MSRWLIVPRDPLIFRDGRPFDNTPGSRAETLPFPFPSTMAGAARTRAGQDSQGQFKAQGEALAALRQIAMRGPLLVTLAEHDPPAFLAPAPADALLLPHADEHKARCLPLVPLAPPDGALVGRPTGVGDEWWPCGPAQATPDKPLRDAPRYWHWQKLVAWLEGSHEPSPVLAELGIAGPTFEQRTHVSIDPATARAADGLLFQTRGLEFVGQVRADAPTPSLSQLHRLALWLEVTMPAVGARPLPEGWATLGGERRPVRWRTTTATLPACPPTIAEKIAAQGHCRLMLLTPAHFKAGAVPQWLLEPRHGVQPTLRGMVVPRPQVVSGWDYEHRQPKPSRRLAAAGSVYFLTLEGSPAARRAWVEAMWLHNVSDDENDDGQAQRDGFGLAALGLWDGKATPMQEGA